MMRSSNSHGVLRNGHHECKHLFKTNRAEKKSRVDQANQNDAMLIPVDAIIKRRKAEMGDLSSDIKSIHFNSTRTRHKRILNKYTPISTALFMQDLQQGVSSLTRSDRSIFDELPPESILLIFSFVTERRDVLNLRRCCRSCRTLLCNRSLRRLLYREDLDRENEEYYKISCDYMVHVQQGITPAMRSVLIEWLIEVADEFRFSPETLFACVNYIDRFLSLQFVTKSRLQLLGSTAMLIACKYEELQAPPVDDFVILSDNLYTKNEILHMESNILTTLGFLMSAVTPRTFLPKYLSYISLSDTRITHLSNFILELALLDYEASRMTASLVAASALCLAFHVLGYSPWTHLLEIMTQLSLSDVDMRKCVDYLYEMLGRSRAAHYVHEKYSQDRHSAVALLPRSEVPFGEVMRTFCVVRASY